MTKIFLIHGSFGNPKENWFPWLKCELERSGCEVVIPEFPTPENQSLEEWKRVFEEYKTRLDEESIVIGHSTGAVFLLSILEELNKKVKACYLISCFTSMPNNLDINKTFTEKEFDWNKIKNNVEHIKLYHSDNDPHIDLKYPKEIANHLNCELEIITEGGHFNEESGYLQFEELLNDIKLII